MKIWKMTTGEWIDTTELIRRNVEYFKWKRESKKQVIKDAGIAKIKELRAKSTPDLYELKTREYKEEYKSIKNNAKKRAYFDR